MVELILRNIKLRYERSILGIIWSIVRPVIQLLVFVLVFKYIIRLEIPNFALYVFIGVLVWNWTSDGLMLSANSIIDNRDLIRQPGFPFILMPIVAIATPLIDLLIAILGLLLYLIFSGSEISVQFALLPLLIGIHFLLLLALGYFLASLQVRYRDTGHLLSVSLMLGFYLTPVFYDIQNIPPGVRSIYLLNPMVHVLTAYRDILMHSRLPDLGALLLLVFIGAVSCSIGMKLFERASHQFAEEL